MARLFALPLGLFVLYALTAAPGAGFEDSVLFALSCLNADPAHAPGYPLYSLLCRPFAAMLPLNPAAAASIFSAVCAAAACGMLASSLRVLLRSEWAAQGGAGLFGVSAGFWAQANIPEVYALNALLFFTALRLTLSLRNDPRPLRAPWLALLCGLGLANHWPLFALAAPALAIALWPARRSLRLFSPRILGWNAAALALGLSPYLYLAWRSHAPAEFSGLPHSIDDWGTFWSIVSRETYAAVDQQGGTTEDKLAFAGLVFKGALWEQVGALAGALAVTGFIVQWRMLGRSMSTALIALFAGGALLLPMLLGFVYDETQAQVFAAYPLLSYAAICMWAAAAAVRWPAARWALGAAAAWALVVNFSENDRRNDTLAEDITRAYFAALPPGAWIPPPWQVSFARYLQITENIRPDVLVVPPPNRFSLEMNFGGGIYLPNSLSYADEVRTINKYAHANPVCYNVFVPFSEEWRSEEYLIFSCLSETGGTVLSPPAENLLRKLMRDPPHPHRRARISTGKIVEDAVRTMLHLRARLQLPAAWKTLLTEARKTPYGVLAELEFMRDAPALIITGRRADEMAATAAEVATSLNSQRISRMHSALGDLYAAVSPRTSQALEAAKAYHKQAVLRARKSSSPVLLRAFNFYHRERLHAEEQALLARYGNGLFDERVIVE